MTRAFRTGRPSFGASFAILALLLCSSVVSTYARAMDGPASSAAPVAGKDAKATSKSSSGSSSGAAAADANPTAAALNQLLQGLTRLASSLPKSSPAPKATEPVKPAATVAPEPAKAPAVPAAGNTTAPPVGATFMEQFVRNHTCNQTMLPNGDFEADAHEAYRISNWIKIKEKGANGGGIIGNGSDPAATGFPGYPFDNKNKYFKSQAFGNVGFALVNQYAIEVNSTRQILYFDWFMDNAFDYWLVPDTMSIHANNSNVTLHAARVDLFDFDKLEPPGNITQLAQYLFDPMNATAGPAYLGPALTVPDIIAFGNLQSVGSYVPLAPYIGKRVLVVFRYSTTVYYMTWGIDNVSVVTCDDSLGFYNRHRHHRRLS